MKKPKKKYLLFSDRYKDGVVVECEIYRNDIRWLEPPFHYAYASEEHNLTLFEIGNKISTKDIHTFLKEREKNENILPKMR